MIKIRIKFRKYGVMRFIGHLDIMRYFQKAMRRAEIDICYSEGFSPHQIMSFAAPLGVGITSDGAVSYTHLLLRKCRNGEFLNMEHKNIVATIYLKNGQAVKGMDNFEPMGWDVISLARLYNDSGIDKIIIFDLSDDDEEHEKNIHTIKNINRNVEIKVCAGGNISRFEDVKKFIYAGCLQVLSLIHI